MNPNKKRSLLELPQAGPKWKAAHVAKSKVATIIAETNGTDTAWTPSFVFADKINGQQQTTTTHRKATKPCSARSGYRVVAQ
jgi:hypothetical protein